MPVILEGSVRKALPDPTLDRDLRALGDRLSALLNNFARRHPGFEPTGLTADYVERPDRDREYLVELSVKL
jgi:hypothetical protein